MAYAPWPPSWHHKIAYRADEREARLAEVAASEFEQERDRLLYARCTALRSVHRQPMRRVDWELMRDAPPSDDPTEREVDDARRTLAAGVLTRDVEAYQVAVDAAHCFAEVRQQVGAHGLHVKLGPALAEVELRAPIDAVIPEKLVTRGRDGEFIEDFTAASRLALYEDYVCGLGLRVARELLSVLPLDEVIVDVWGMVTQAGTPAAGSLARIASVLCPRSAMDTVDWSTADASEVLDLLAHEMSFDPRAGFAEVPRITRD